MRGRAVLGVAVGLGLGLLCGCGPTPIGPGPTGDGGLGGGEGGVAGPMNVDEKEPNNDPMAPQSLGTIADTTTIVIKGDLSSGGNDGTKYTGDWDMYSFDITNSGKLEVSIDWTASADLDFAVYDASNKAVISEGMMMKPAAGSQAGAQGKYLLGIFSKDNATPYTATLKYTKDAAGMGDMCPKTPVMPAMWSGGCNMDVTTAACSTADLTNGKSFELDWTTNTTFCEGPHKVQIGGDPPSSWTSGNYVEISISSQNPGPRAGMTRNIGGYVNVNAADFQSLTSSTGIYYYRVSSYYGSASEVRAFKVVR